MNTIPANLKILGIYLPTSAVSMVRKTGCVLVSAVSTREDWASAVFEAKTTKDPVQAPSIRSISVRTKLVGTPQYQLSKSWRWCCTVLCGLAQFAAHVAFFMSMHKSHANVYIFTSHVRDDVLSASKIPPTY